MPTHAEKRELPYRPEQLFDLVADIERYPEFLPWCVGARVRSREADLVVADLVIGFKMVRERFTTQHMTEEFAACLWQLASSDTPTLSQHENAPASTDFSAETHARV